MSAIVIDGCPPWDGRYDFDDFSFTNRELYEIKQLSGLRAAELIEALEANDTSAFVGVAMVVLARNGLRVDVNDLWDAKVGSIQIDLGSVEAAEDVPPPSTPDDGLVTTPVGSGSVSNTDGG